MVIRKLNPEEIKDAVSEVLETQQESNYEQMRAKVASYGAVNSEAIVQGLVGTPLRKKGKTPEAQKLTHAAAELVAGEVQMTIKPNKKTAVQMGSNAMVLLQAQKLSDITMTKLGMGMRKNIEQNFYPDFCEGNWIGADRNSSDMLKCLIYYKWKLAQSMADPEDTQKATIARNIRNELNMGEKTNFAELIKKLEPQKKKAKVSKKQKTPLKKKLGGKTRQVLQPDMMEEKATLGEKVEGIFMKVFRGKTNAAERDRTIGKRRENSLEDNIDKDGMI